MRKSFLMVAVVIALLVLPAGVTAQATPNFNWSPGVCLSPDTYQVNFILHDFTGIDLTGTFVQWTGTVNGVAVSGVSPFERIAGNIAHYRGIVTVPDGPATWVITSATLSLPGFDNPPLALDNPGAGAADISCRPLGIILETFGAEVETPLPNCSVLLTATSNGGSAANVVFWRDDLVIATLPASFSGGEYRYTDNPPPRPGSIQTHDYKVVQGSDTLIDSVNCAPQVPTAVTLASFTTSRCGFPAWLSWMCR